MKPVVDAIKNLLSNLPPTLTDSQVSSVKKNLKMQLLNLLKNRGSIDMQHIIVALLQDLGASIQEISRAIPKIDKQEQQRRAKRNLENANETSSAKRTKVEAPIPIDSRPMEIDYDELDQQKLRSNKLNEKFIADHLNNLETVVQLVMASITSLPNEIPTFFTNSYKPIVNMSKAQQITKIASMLAEQMTESRIGPGTSAFTKEPPMRLCAQTDDDDIITTESRTVGEESPIIDLEMAERDEGVKNSGDIRKEEATKKLRETMERAKGCVQGLLFVSV